MPRVRHETVVLGSLDRPAREALTEALYRVNAEIFDGVTRENFRHHVMEAPTEWTRILIHRDDTDRIVGYVAFHLYRHVFRGREIAVLRSQSGFLREHRGGAGPLLFGFRSGIDSFIHNLRVPLYFFACLIHPSGYHTVYKYLRPVWPSPDAPLDAEQRALIGELGDSFGFERIGEDPLIRFGGWWTRESDAERAFWQRCDKPDVRFFIESNPGYDQGQGLLTLVPIDLALLANGVGRIARDKAGFVLSNLSARVHHLPIAAQLLAPRQVRRRLRGVALFESLDDARLDALASRSQVVSLPAQRQLLRQGERGEELYVIDSGAVHVTASRGGHDVLLDQLDPGDVLGEIGALTGEPRTASVRTATRATLIRLDRRALLDAMDADPVLAESIWRRYAERQFEYVAETHPGLGRMSRAECFAFLRRGTSVELAAGRQWSSPGPGLVFIVRGEVAIEQAGARISGRAPLLLDIGEVLQLDARSAVRVIELPSPLLPPLFTVFRPHPMLAGLSDAELIALLRAGRTIRREGAELLFVAGEKADAFYLIESGAVEIVIGDAVIRRLGVGECFGERGLDPAGSGVRTAGARTVGETSLVRVVGEAFRRIAGEKVFGVYERTGW